MKITIERLGNGYLLTNHQDPPCRLVVEEEDLEEDTFTKLLGLIAEELGCPYDKYSDKNLNISFDKKGHKLWIMNNKNLIIAEKKNVDYDHANITEPTIFIHPTSDNWV